MKVARQMPMRPFQCTCGASIYFENVSCLACKRELGFVPEELALSALELASEGNYRSHLKPEVLYTKCENYSMHNACNWLVPSDPGGKLCRACQLNRVIPDLSLAENRIKWARVESAKRRLIYTIDKLGLPLQSKLNNAELGLAFDIMADTVGNVVLTGHDEGIVTLKLDEADPVTCEKTRVAMNEPYRSILGHLRHESGHYFFDRLLHGGPELQQFRALFGDEQKDYTQALNKHYASRVGAEPSPDFVSQYASSHPLEDWAESWAHYLHMVDTMETAQTFGAMTEPATTFDELIENWLRLTIILNALNRSMGLHDAYPFQISEAVRGKLEFIHEVVLHASSSGLPTAKRPLSS